MVVMAKYQPRVKPQDRAWREEGGREGRVSFQEECILRSTHTYSVTYRLAVAAGPLPVAGGLGVEVVEHALCDWMGWEEVVVRCV